MLKCLLTRKIILYASSIGISREVGVAVAFTWRNGYYFLVTSFSTLARALLSVKNASGLALFGWQSNSWQKPELFSVLLRSVAFTNSVSFILLLQDTENQGLSLDLKAFRAGLAGLGIVLHGTHHIDCSCCRGWVGWMWVPSWRHHGSRCWASAAVAALSFKAEFRPSVQVLPLLCCKRPLISVGKLVKVLMQVPRPRFSNGLLSTPTV